MRTTITNKLRVAAFGIALLAAGAVNAQTAGGQTDNTNDVGREAAATAFGSNEGYVKVVDNKGTIKYLQSNNGISMFTDFDPNGGIVTTWQLGGTLTDNTYIDASGAEFGITGLSAIDPTVDAAAAISDIQATAYDTTGYTIVVRDEATGEFKKVLASEIFEVTAIREEVNVLANVTATGTENLLVPGLPVIDAVNQTKLFVFRNGVKLRWNTDFTGATAGSIDINISGDLPLFNGDVIEVQYIN